MRTAGDRGSDARNSEQIVVIDCIQPRCCLSVIKPHHQRCGAEISPDRDTYRPLGAILPRSARLPNASLARARTPAEMPASRPEKVNSRERLTLRWRETELRPPSPRRKAFLSRLRRHFSPPSIPQPRGRPAIHFHPGVRPRSPAPSPSTAWRKASRRALRCGQPACA